MRSSGSTPALRCVLCRVKLGSSELTLGDCAPATTFMNASAHGDVPRSRRLAGHRFEAGRGRLAHLVNAYLDEMSKTVIGLVGHVLKRLGDGLMALVRYDAAQENDAERTTRHFDERGDKIEAQKEFEARLSVRGTCAPVIDFFPAAGAVEAALGLPADRSRRPGARSEAGEGRRAACVGDRARRGRFADPCSTRFR